MKFARYAFACLLPSFATAKLNDNDQNVVRQLLDKVEELQDQISNLKEEVANNGNGHTVHFRSTHAGQGRSNTYRRKNNSRRGLSSATNNKQGRRARGSGGARRGLDDKKGDDGKGSKAGNGFHSVCYGGGGEVSAAHINEMFWGGDFAREKIDVGLVEVNEDEGVMIDVSAATYILNIVGGVQCEGGTWAGDCMQEIGSNRKLTPSYSDPEGGRFFINGGGLLMYPIVRKCDQDELDVCFSKSFDDDFDECVENACFSSGTLVQAEPAAALPLTIQITGGYEATIDTRDRKLSEGTDQNDERELFWFGSNDDGHVDYEIDGFFNVQSQNIRFYLPNEDVGSSTVYVELAIVAATGGIHMDTTRVTKTSYECDDYHWFWGCKSGWETVLTNYTNLYVDDWTVGVAGLGPHLIEVSTMQALDGACNITETEDD